MLTGIVHGIAFFFGRVGALLIICGGIRAIIDILKREILREEDTYDEIRTRFAGQIIFGLEFFIAADIREHPHRARPAGDPDPRGGRPEPGGSRVFPLPGNPVARIIGNGNTPPWVEPVIEEMDPFGLARTRMNNDPEPFICAPRKKGWGLSPCPGGRDIRKARPGMDSLLAGRHPEGLDRA